MEIAKYVLGLVLLILKEYFAFMKKKRETEQTGKLEIEEFKKIVDQAVIRLRASYKQENSQVGNVEDQMDRERQRSQEGNSSGNS